MSENGNGQRRDAQGKFLPADADTDQEQQPEQTATAAVDAQEQQPEQTATAAVDAQEQQPAAAGAQDPQPQTATATAAVDAAAQEQQPGLFSRFGSGVATASGKVWSAVRGTVSRVAGVVRRAVRGAVSGVTGVVRRVFGQWPRVSWATTGAVLVLVGAFTYQQRDDVADFVGAPVATMFGASENACDRYASQPPSAQHVVDLRRGGVRVYPAATWCAYNASLAYNLAEMPSVAGSIVMGDEEITVRDCISHLPAQTDGGNVYSRACTALLRGGQPIVMTSDLYQLVAL